MSLLRPDREWHDLERRALLDLATLQLPHEPEAIALCGLWRWFSLGTHVTWAVFRLTEADYVVRARWDRQEAAEFMALREGLPGTYATMPARVFRRTMRAPSSLVDLTLDSLHRNLDAVPAAAIGIDGTQYGFEILEAGRLQRVEWWENSIRESTLVEFESRLVALEKLFD